jgi:spore coat polysaccharide biosynthesis protein SpsF
MILAILQARMSSTRFPGKVLAPLHGRPMILRQIERVRRSALIDELVVATSSDPSDDELARVLTAEGVAVRRGPLADVVGRFAAVVTEFDPDHLVRLTADCPLTDPGVIDRVIREQLDSGADYTANTQPPSFPDGLDVEVVAREAFARLLAADLTPRQREHVTLGIVERPAAFAIRNVAQSPSRAQLRWTVDVPADLEFVRVVYARLYDEDPAFGQAAILALLDREPALSRTEQDLARNAGLQKE